MTYPRLLLISDLPLSLSDSSKFANPTLYNLFKNYPSECIFQCLPHSTLKTHPASIDHQQVVSYRNTFLPSLRNRFGTYVNPWIEYVDFSILNTIPFLNLNALEDFRPAILVICPITLSCLIFAKKIVDKLKIPFLIYFMDDWLAKNTTSWIGGNVQSLAHQMLKESTGWIMISDFLQEEFAKRFKIFSKPCVIAHNPVSSILSKLVIQDKLSKTFQIAYAGSIQPLHEDSFLLVAQSIYELRQEGVDIELITYTPVSFWEKYRNVLISFDVINGSLIPYSKLHITLSQSDLLLVSTSFNLDYEYPVRSSLLTKLTDYMASGKPILSCGPEYSACNKFLEKWNCGVICSSNSIDQIKTCLRWCISNQESISDLAQTALDVLKNNFSESVVQDKLYTFIENMAHC